MLLPDVLPLFQLLVWFIEETLSNNFITIYFNSRGK
jgi:hypothetical protein